MLTYHVEHYRRGINTCDMDFPQLEIVAAPCPRAKRFLNVREFLTNDKGKTATPRRSPVIYDLCNNSETIATRTSRISTEVGQIWQMR